MAKDYYNLLGVSKNSSEEEIKKAFRALAHQYHPDKKSGNETKFKELNEAYQVLSDPEKRKKYDQFGASFEQMGGWESATGGAHWEDIMNAFRQGGARAGGNFGGNEFAGFSFDIGDIFSEFFGGRASSSSMSGASRSRSSRGRDIEIAIEIEFLEAVTGAERTLELKKFDKCSRCKGNRAEPGTPLITCKECGGRGEVSQTRQTILGVMRTSGQCGKCGGEGVFPKLNCKHCNGDGMERVAKKIKVRIPAGIQNGEAIRISGEGEISENAARYGDLYVGVRIRSHHKFKRDGDDIHSSELISFTQAALGDKIRADTAHGKVELKIPAGTESGTAFKLKHKGVPSLRGGGEGDHYVTVKIVVPERVSAKAKKLLNELKEEGL